MCVVGNSVKVLCGMCWRDMRDAGRGVRGLEVRTNGMCCASHEDENGWLAAW